MTSYAACGWAMSGGTEKGRADLAIRLHVIGGIGQRKKGIIIIYCMLPPSETTRILALVDVYC